MRRSVSVHINLLIEPSGPAVPVRFAVAAARAMPQSRAFCAQYTRASCWRITGSSDRPACRARPSRSSKLPPRRPWPLVSRSKPRMVSATFQPSPTSPMRMSSPTRTPVRNTSLNEAPPVICRIGRTSSPGASSGTMNAVIPACLGTSGSVRQMANPQGERLAVDVHTFWPSMTHSSPSRTALVDRPARSLPAPGSENSWQQNSSQCANRATHRSRCSGVPNFSIAGAINFEVTATTS